MQKRFSCCARHPPPPQCSVTTLTCPVQSPNIFGNVAIVCATSCGVREIQVKLQYRLHHAAGMVLNRTPGLDLLWSNPGWKTGHAVARGIPVRGALCLPVLARGSLDSCCTEPVTSSCIIPLPNSQTGGLNHVSTALLTNYPPPIH